MITTYETKRLTTLPATLVVGFLTVFLALNTYWGLGGTRGLAWVLGCDCPPPLALVWLQEAAIVAGIGVVLTSAGLWSPPVPAWVPRMGIRAMVVTFTLVGLTNLFGDNILQARLVFAPFALALAVCCLVVARSDIP